MEITLIPQGALVRIKTNGSEICGTILEIDYHNDMVTVLADQAFWSEGEDNLHEVSASEVEVLDGTKIYRVWLTNFSRFLDQTSEHIGAAITIGEKKGFEFSIIDNFGECYCYWSPIGGLRSA